MTISYSVLLPKTDFPMKGSLATTEPLIEAWWKEINLYAHIRNIRKNRPVKVLGDGPPYSNGEIHLGHALNKILKDIINRFNALHGSDIDFIPGWDCHGLPIESKVEKQYLKEGYSKSDVPVLKLRQDCKISAEYWIKRQSAAFQRLGVLGDFDHFYSTMQPSFEAAVIESLFKMLRSGYIYQGTRPVLWSCAEQTALAEAEVEYKDIRSTALYVKFALQRQCYTKLAENPTNVSIVIWTTTPWSLPGNRAICYNPEISYILVRVDTQTGPWEQGECFLIAEDRLLYITQILQLKDYTVVQTVPQAILTTMVCHHPLYKEGYTFNVPLLPAEHVTCDVGTGFVHTAPSHGPEDFAVGLKYGLEIPETILPDGRFSEDIPIFSGMDMWKGISFVSKALRNAGTLVMEHAYDHSYPHSWRSKTPLCYRVTPQWFIRLDQGKTDLSLREQAINAVENGSVSWHPKGSHKRLSTMLSHRPDWCISRQRAWGIPLMFFVHKHTGAYLDDLDIFQTLCERVRKEGVDFWFTDAPFNMFPQISPQEWTKVEDIMDVWLESGLTHMAVLKPRDKDGSLWPAWAYLEGSDQHRGWFQSSLLTGIALEGRPPFKSVLTHGFLLDDQGAKQSKSQGNVIDPIEFAGKNGADMLRLWVAHEDYEKDISVGDEVFARVKDIYRKCRNTLKFLLGALHDLREEELLPVQALDFLSRRVLWNMSNTHDALFNALALEEVIDAEFQGKSVNIQLFLRTLLNFCTDLSACYLDVKKDALYCDAVDALNRKQVRTTLLYCFVFLCKHLSAILSFTTEEAFSMFGKEILGINANLRTSQWEEDIQAHHRAVLSWMVHRGLLQKPAYWSVHLQDVFSPFEEFKNWDGAECSAHLLEIRSDVTAVLETYRKSKYIGSSLEAAVSIELTDQDRGIAGSHTSEYTHILQELCMISDCSISWNAPKRSVTVDILTWKKCPRCWKRAPEVSTLALCKRCAVLV